jgi:hypothetical protein
VTPPFYIVKAEDAEYLPAKISGFTCSALSILGLTVAQRHGPLVPTGHSYGRPVLPKRAIVAASEKDMAWIRPVHFWAHCQRHMSAPFSAKNISLGIFLGLMPTQEGDICAW